MGRFRAVLFDWRGTLVHIPEPAWLITHALESIGRPVDPDMVEGIVTNIRTAEEAPEFVEAERHIDSSTELHRPISMRLFERAGLDGELADTLYRIEWHKTSRPLYPDVPEVLAAVQALGVKIALVSNIHFDIRSDCAEQRIDALIDAYVLSFEHRFQKPDPRMFQLALDALRVEAGDALMVGDWAPNDGGAVSIGISTLILPRPTELGPRGLDVVLRLLE
jgi:HAD superfamily hydrolase (TIGR01493 family)